MLKVVVRGGSDASAVKACCERFFEGVVDGVVRVGGRGESFWTNVYEYVKEVSDREFVLVLCGKEDLREEWFEYLDSLPNVSVVAVPKAKVRNATLGELMKYINVGRAKLRLSIGTEGEALKMKVPEHKVLDSELIDPGFDLFLLIDEGIKLLEELLGVEIRGDSVAVSRMYGGEHRIYGIDGLIAKLRILDEGARPAVLSVGRGPLNGFSFLKSLVVNKDVLTLYEAVSANFIKSATERYENVVVPWSGGKDSTAVLILAATALGSSRITAVYVDTGVDFPFNKEYIEDVARRLGIKYVEVRANIREEILKGREFPTHENRWCTYLKKRAVLDFISREYAGEDVAVVIGDRDAESIGRSRKAFIEPEPGHSNIMNIYPIKLWSAAHVQLYISMKGTPLNKLYMLGFYRVGCYICPALRSWEFYVILNTVLKGELLQDEIARKYFSLRLKKGFNH